MQKVKDFTLKKKETIFIVATFSFFIFSMLYNLTHSALWGDEWVEYNFSRARINNGDMYSRIISTFQPPLYNFVMHFWLKISDSVLWFRLFNVFIGFGSGLFLYNTVRKICSEKVALISILGLSTCYSWVYCIQECSEYAIMLFFLFGAMFFFVNTYYNDNYANSICLILFCVAAVFSQYGSAFVVVPLLVAYYLNNILAKDKTVKRKIIITAMYLASALVFAAPLYFLFAKKQMEKNEISGHTIPLSIGMCKDILFELGRILGYFFNLNSENNWVTLWSLISIILIIAIVWLIVLKSTEKIKKIVLIMLGSSYIVHFFLVKMHIYAMVHPNISAGFYARYSYFYIPYFCIAIPIIVVEIFGKISGTKSKYVFCSACGIGVACAALSFFSLLENWDKALDDEFAEIWYEEEGWEDTTYLIGMAKYGFDYYVKNDSRYSEDYMSNVSQDLDVNNLPIRFWLWRTNWGGDSWQLAIDEATKLGYTINVYNDSGYVGQLAYCYYEGETEE